MDPTTWRIVRCPKAGLSRPLDEVSLIEIGNAMVVVAEQTGGIGADELKREALNLFGGRRLTQAITTRLDDGLSRALSDGRLTKSSSGTIGVAQP